MDDLVLSAPDPKDTRFSLFRQRIEAFFRWRWNQDTPWGPAEANQLARLLRECPTLDIGTFSTWLRNYGFSQDITPGQRPCKFLSHIHDYSVTPLDRFRRSQDAIPTTSAECNERAVDAAFERARASRCGPPANGNPARQSIDGARHQPVARRLGAPFSGRD